MLKNISIAKWGVLLVMALAIGACTDDFTELNKNPNSPVDVPAVNILASANLATANAMAGWWNHTYLACWNQMFAKIQYIDEDKYKYRTSNMNGFWNATYLRLKDLQIVIEKTQADGFANIEAVARIMRAYNYSVLTDAYGDVPYSEALQADADVQIITPVYDTQESIYKALVAELAAAAAVLKLNEGDDLNALAAADVIYGGDVALWEKFANSLQLRLYMRMSGADPATAKTGFEAAAAKSIFESNAEDAQLDYLVDRNWWNPLYATNYTRNDFGMSKTMIDILQDAGRNDPRLPFYAQRRTFDDTYVGQPNGAASDPSLADVSMIGITFGYTETAPQVFISYAEVHFLLAEAALNGWTVPGGNHYVLGITASMEKVGVAAADLATYLTEALVAPVTRQTIGEQKWIALFPQGQEGFAEVRRTGFPALTPIEAPFYPSNPGLPFRFAYPLDEDNYNAANLEAASVGIDESGLYGNKVWWDTRPRPANGM